VKIPEWVLRETVITVHEQLLAAFGGTPGMRDEHLLESALARPVNRFAYGKSVSRFDLAASYGVGLVKNHAFVDGNKRIGFTVAILFLALNGYTFAATEADATVQTLALAAGEIGEAEYAVWLKANSRRTRRPRR
jgi:death-on-curing protein